MFSQGKILKNVRTPNILHCSQLRPFWVSYDAGEITVGTGFTDRKHVLLKHKVLTGAYDVKAVAVSGWKDAGEFEFTQEYSKS